jgi:hypothetical protein
VRNTGGSATAVLTVGTSTVDFILTANGCGGSVLAPNATCSVSLVFRPATPGTKTALLTISGAAGETAVAALAGTGTSP